MAKDKNYFEKVNIKVKFPKMEKELLGKWEKEGLVDKYLQKNKSSKKHFSFMDGPITANNPMGVHHAWGRTYKDLWQRFKNMQGYSQRFQNGFDSQGLWVEVEVEKELGFKNKKEIEKYGVAKFVEKCKARVRKYSDIQTEQSKRLGYFMDWDNSYFTMSDENNYMIWHFIKVCHENGWLYKGKESVPWCPRCETAISQHEMLTEDYKDVTHKSIVIKFPIKNKKDEFLLVWTTTPWTIPANIAIAVDKDMNYSLVLGEDRDKYWVAREAVKRVFKGKKQEIVKTVKGKELIGLVYSGPFDDLPAVKRVAEKNSKTFHTVIPTDSRIMPITADEGTGLVHTAVSAGTEDFKLGKKLGLPMIPVIADDASYLPDFGFLSGENAKKHPELILDFLSKENAKWVFEISNYKHRYPACWRCKTELVWKVTDEWYIAMDKPAKKDSEGKDTLRERMKRVTKDITWMPEFGLKRELDWLNNMHDWLISKKNRYWGLCLPIWECTKCKYFEVVGGKEELKKKAIKGWEQFEGKSPHKPFLDKVKVECTKCGGEASRIEPVGTPWLDAGIVSFSTITKDNIGKPLYLSDKKEWEKWFPADFITESFPGQFKNWFYAMIAMSAVLENRAPYKTVLGFATLFGENGKPMHKSTGNMVEFNEGADKIGVDVMRWIYARQNPSENLAFGYKLGDEVRRQFHLKLWNVYNFFVTYANLNGWEPKGNDSINNQKLSPLDEWILSRLGEVVDEVTKKLEDYSPHKASEYLEIFLDDLSNWYIRRSRGRLSFGVDNINDKNAFFSTSHQVLTTLVKLLAPFIPFITDAIYTNLTKEESVHLSEWPVNNYKIDKALIGEMRSLRDVVEIMHAKRKEAQIPVRRPLNSLASVAEKPKFGSEYLFEEEMNVKKVKWGAKKNEIDTKITPEIKMDEKVREIVRNIQMKRREMGTELNEKINVSLDDDLPKDRIEEIKRKTLTKEIRKGEFKVERVK